MFQSRNRDYKARLYCTLDLGMVQNDAHQCVPDNARILKVESQPPFNLAERARGWDHEPSTDMLENVDGNGMLTIYWVTFEQSHSFEDE